MKRYCFALDLKDDPERIEEYIEHHADVWPEIVASIAAAGVSEMEIYNVADRLFMIMETTDDFDPEAKAAADKYNPKVQQWEALMERYQQRLPFADDDQKWVPMDRIFSLTEHQRR